jgi:23S rRNA pseudouridine2605 synthase
VAKSTTDHSKKSNAPFEKFYKKKAATPEVEEKPFKKKSPGSYSKSTTPKNKSFDKDAVKPYEKGKDKSSFVKKRTEGPNFDKPQRGKKEEAPTTSLDSKIQKRIKKLNEPTGPVAVEEVAPIESMRLNKFLAHAGIASRRKADELIAGGKVKVNGEVVTEMGYRVKAADKITFEEKRITPESKVYILLNKPKDCITTTTDERDRKTVLDLIRSAYQQIKSVKKPRLYPVGRLDRNTTGVLLITNDGELAQNLTHPSKEIKKIYQAVLDKNLKPDDFERIQHGVVLEDGIAEVTEVAYTNQKSKNEIGIEIHSGKNRIVRRIFESLGYEVVKLDRVYFGGLTKKDLPRGRWRFLEEEEVRRLKHFKIG